MYTFSEGIGLSCIALASLGVFWRIVTYFALYLISNPVKPNIRPSDQFFKKNSNWKKNYWKTNFFVVVICKKMKIIF